jgi:hypothetical protein
MQDIDDDPTIIKTGDVSGLKGKWAKPPRGVLPNESDIYMSSYNKNGQTPLGSTNAPIRRKGPVATSTKQMAGYFTVSGIENELSIPWKNSRTSLYSKVGRD